jgi:hypothetical protein
VPGEGVNCLDLFDPAVIGDLTEFQGAYAVLEGQAVYIEQGRRSDCQHARFAALSGVRVR